ncbi:hypothetical protein OH799_06775 [Nocardia sp. NBC_00881]|uniref:hypothetical protein n=1 Tax=Nocardia sp. NBC_00881 TaxID=2975995 RepID=UPI00386EDFF0|nr:hypothetical protein OH799_06775 [Nocardia sp. NBC_00881]
MRSHKLPALLAIATGLALAACSDNEPSATPTTQTTAKLSAVPTTAAEQQSTAAFTPAGTTLSIGGKAIVPFEFQKKNGAVGITVTKIDKGDPADLASLKLGDKAAGMTPYYVRIQVSNESGSEFANSSLRSLGGLLADGKEAKKIAVIGTFEKCDNESAGKDFTTNGATYQTCSVVLAPGSATVTKASYADPGAKEQGQDYGRKPIIWG